MKKKPYNLIRKYKDDPEFLTIVEQIEITSIKKFLLQQYINFMNKHNNIYTYKLIPYEQEEV